MIKRGTHAFRRQFDIAGVIRLGGEQSLGEWNQELSYFRLTSQDPNVTAAAKLARLYGEKPTELHVMFPSDDPDEVFEDEYELWRGSRKKDVKGVLLCRGDGVYAHRIIDEDNPFEREQVACPCPEDCAFAAEHTPEKLRSDGGSSCGPLGRLRVICYRVSVLEVYEIRTGSWNAFQGIRNKLLDIAEHPLIGGRLKSVPVILKRVPKKNRFGKTNYPVKIEVPPLDEWVKEVQFLRSIGDKLGRVTSISSSLPEPKTTQRQLGAPEDFPDEKVARSSQAPVGEEPKTLAQRLAEATAEEEPEPEITPTEIVEEEPAPEPVRPETRPSNGGAVATRKKLF